MLEYFLAFIKQHELIASNEQVILAVSGGMDSMTMADLFSQSRYPFAVAHINYGLRSVESDKDMQFVEEWCDQKGIECFIRNAPKNIFDQNDSVQMAARTFRYEFFDELLKTKGYHKIATAHHLDDSLETALFNFTKGTGLRGLRGIIPIHEQIIRPLLFADKERISAYANEAKLKWREDYTNQETHYQRNKLRHEVIPVLKSINPNLLRSFDTVSQRITDAQDLLTQTSEEIKQAHVTWKDQVMIIALAWMSRFRNPRPLLSELLRPYGFTYLQVMDILDVIDKEVTGKLFFSSSYELNIDREQLLIRPKNEEEAVNETLKIPGEASLLHYTIETKLVNGHEFSDQEDPMVAYLDYDKMGEVKIARWKEGDVFQPLGMRGKKKVSDFMIDSKIPLTLKRDVLIVRSQNEIAWVVGHRIDERFKVTSGTQKMLRIQFQKDV